MKDLLEDLTALTPPVAVSTDGIRAVRHVPRSGALLHNPIFTAPPKPANE
jgi:hypothetical protein